MTLEVGSMKARTARPKAGRASATRAGLVLALVYILLHVAIASGYLW